MFFRFGGSAILNIITFNSIIHGQKKEKNKSEENYWKQEWLQRSGKLNGRVTTKGLLIAEILFIWKYLIKKKKKKKEEEEERESEKEREREREEKDWLQRSGKLNGRVTTKGLLIAEILFIWKYLIKKKKKKKEEEEERESEKERERERERRKRKIWIVFCLMAYQLNVKFLLICKCKCILEEMKREK